MKKYITDPMVRASLRAHKKTDAGKLAALVSEQTRWQRRACIAQNKLRAAQAALVSHAQDMAAKLLEGSR
jgi:hypothetical protein